MTSPIKEPELTDLYFCDAHGVGQSNCCKEADKAGWIESQEEGNK